MTKQEAAIIEVFTGIVMLTGEDRKFWYEYTQNLMGRPVYTHEIADKVFREELKEKSKVDFLKLCETLTDSNASKQKVFDVNFLEKDLREYADSKFQRGEPELANGILSAVCRIKALAEKDGEK